MQRIRRYLLLFLIVCLLCAGQAAAAPSQLIAGGTAVGLSIDTDAVIVTGFSNRSPAELAGIQIGDKITAVNNARIRTVDELRTQLERLQGGNASVEVQREGKEYSYRITPVKTAQGWMLGLLVKDHINGIGTLTYYDPESGRFGALGHGVGLQVDDTMQTGSVLGVQIVEVQKSVPGSPGALLGVYDQKAPIGSIDRNLPQGVFGYLQQTPQGGVWYPVANEDEVELGAATILCTLDTQQIEEYSIEITELRKEDENNRNLKLRVTDPDLVAQTGGIVQGISGAPILQNGKLVGAVTHVLVDRPDRGYGILIAKMLAADAASAS